MWLNIISNAAVWMWGLITATMCVLALILLIFVVNLIMVFSHLVLFKIGMMREPYWHEQRRLRKEIHERSATRDISSPGQ